MSKLKILFAVISIVYACSTPKQKADLVIENGSIIDGSGEKSYKADIAIRDNKIIDITPEWKGLYTSEKIIDARGYIVSPGFIDPHTHAFDDLNSTERNACLNYLSQGVTTVIVGNDGGGPVLVQETFDKWQEQGIGVNAGLLVGHGTIRKLAMGMGDNDPDEATLQKMQTFTTRAMEEGALGLSTGLFYAPGSYAKTEEVIALAKIAAQYGGIYDTHLRDESSYNIGLVAAVKEAITISKEADIPLHISHIKCLGTDVWGKSQEIIALVDSCQKAGMAITANQYPYNASGTNVVSALFPRSALVGGPDMFQQRLDQAESLNSIKVDVKENMRKRGGAATLLITRYADTTLIKKNIKEVAEIWQMDTVDAAVEIARNGNARLASFNMQETDMANFMQQEWIVTGSDGSTGHPRKYGSFPRKLEKYVLEEKVIDLPAFIRNSSAKTAEIFGINNRGYLKQGYQADIIIFKPEEVQENATFQNPEALSEGIHWVLVNGQLVIEEGKYNGKLVGEVVER